MLKFLFALVAAGLVVSVASIGWGRFTSQPKPEPLVTVAGFVTQTPVGAAISQVLGATDEQPINLASAASSLFAAAAGAVQNRVAQSISSQAIQQISNQYESLAPEQRELLEAVICKPASPAAGTQ
jgi:hypothetical protein